MARNFLALAFLVIWAPIVSAQQTSIHNCAGTNLPAGALTQSVTGDLTLTLQNCTGTAFTGASSYTGFNFYWTTSTSPTNVTASLSGTSLNSGTSNADNLPDGNILFQLAGTTAETIEVAVVTNDSSYSDKRAVYTFTLNPSFSGPPSSSSSTSSSSGPTEPVPALPFFALLALGSLLGLLGLRKIKA